MHLPEVEVEDVEDVEEVEEHSGPSTVVGALESIAVVEHTLEEKCPSTTVENDG
jgi:hypothetical protein